MSTQVAMEASSPPLIAKKLWNIVRIVFFMLRKNMSKKSKFMIDLHYMFKRGNKIAEKAMDNLILHHHNLSCRPNDADLAFFSPREYEFSCSNSPAVGQHYRRRHRQSAGGLHYRHHSGAHQYGPGGHHHDTNMSITVRKVIEMLNKNNHNYSYSTTNGNERAKSDDEVHAVPDSPMMMFGPSLAAVRQLRITDSPYSVKGNNEEDTTQDNKTFDDFINKFYNELKTQKTVESTYQDPWAD